MSLNFLNSIFRFNKYYLKIKKKFVIFIKKLVLLFFFIFFNDKSVKKIKIKKINKIDVLNESEMAKKFFVI